MTASSRSSMSTLLPSGTLKISMPSSAGASAENDTSRWDPGRRPSSRVSSTSGALGSRLRKISLPWWCRQNLRESTGRGAAPPKLARPARSVLVGAGSLSEALGQLGVHVGRNQAGDVAAEHRHLLDQRGGQERP